MKEEATNELISRLSSLAEQCHDQFAGGEFVYGISKIMACLRIVNRIFHEKEPWVLVKKGQHEPLYDVIYLSLETLRICAILMQPVIPHISDRILNKLNIPQSERYWEDAVWRPSRINSHQVHKLNPEKIMAFPRLK